VHDRKSENRKKNFHNLFEMEKEQIPVWRRKESKGICSRGMEVLKEVIQYFLKASKFVLISLSGEPSCHLSLLSTLFYFKFLKQFSLF
jgi:hypothetical protein